MSTRTTITVGALGAALLLAACPGSKTDVADPNDKQQDVVTTPPDDSKPPDEAKPEEPANPDPVAAYATECRAGLSNAKTMLPSIVAAQATRTEANTLVPYNEMMRQIELSYSSAGLMQSVHPDEGIREAARACEQDVSKFMTELSLNRELYEAFVALDTSKMDANTKRLVEHAIRDFKRAGVDKDEATRKRIKEIKDQLTMVGQQFQKTIADDTRSETFKPEELEGLPEDFIKAHPKQPDGTIKLTTNYPDYIPFIQYAKDHEAKKRLYIQFRSRGGEINEKNLRKILKLRAELATLLGYPNWADYVTEDKMMKSGANAAKFIKRVVKVAQKRAKKDYRELLKAKRKEIKGAKRVEDYEKSYYENKVKTDKYAFDPQSVRPYFEYEQTEKGLLEITSKIYGIEYKPVDPKEAKVWHPSVKAFDVMKDGKKIGRIYLDMHPREGKYKHAAQFTKQSGVDGVQLPEGVLVCNFPDPAKGKALMEHDDVTTMFHEFGHLMHHIFGGQGKKWIDQSGVATEWDFVEAPSQMFEEWAWSHDTLKLFAKHHETGEVIPKEMVDKMRRAKKFGLGVQTLQQMFYASISLEFYRNDPDKLDMLGMVKKLQKKYTPFRYVDGTRFHASFGHLYGYSAQYYTYMWSLVIAKDLLTPFKKHGLMNTDWTYKYRDVILGQGGTKDAAVLVEEFLGRPFNYKAFEKFLGG